MLTPYLVVRELLPCGRLAWRRMVNPQFPAIDLQRNLKPIDLTRHVINHKPIMVFNK